MTTRVAVPLHEDVIDDSTGQLCTVYTIVVSRTMPDGKVTEWQLKKRFSSFLNLYSNIKDRYQKELESYVFPHKSMFNTFSKFTKDRRRIGFDELLATLVKIDPLPLDLEDFLEIDDHLGDGRARPHFLKSTASPTPGSTGAGQGFAGGAPHGHGNGNSVSGTGAVVGSSAIAGQVPHNGSSSSGQGTATPKESAIEAVVPPADAPRTPVAASASSSPSSSSTPSFQLTDVHRTFITMLVCVGTVYAAAVLVGVVDISSTSVVRMIVTVLSLVSTATYVRWLVTHRQSEVAHISSLSDLINNIASTTTTPVRSVRTASVSGASPAGEHQ